MKIAITGANGFLGSRLASRLSEGNMQTIAILREGANLQLLSPDAVIRVVDYHQPASILNAIQDCDVLIHNAGKVRTHTAEEMLDANLGITSRVLKAVNQSSLKHFIYISSQAASAPSPNGEAIDEDYPSAPVNWYGKSKLWAERVIQKSCKIPYTIIRPVPVYGEGDKDFFSLFKAAAMGLCLGMGNDKQLINMIHVDQLCDLIKLCLCNPAAHGEIFFASDGQSYTQKEISDSIAGATGRKTISINVPDLLANIVFTAGELWEKVSRKTGLINRQKYLELSASHWNCSCDKAVRLLGWKPSGNLQDLLKTTYLWYKDNGWL